MRILWLANVPSPYRVDFFNELGKLCKLTVVFEKNTSDERDVSWSKYRFENFKGVILRGRSINTDSAICPGVVRYINNKFDQIVVTNFSSPTGIIAITYMKIHKINYWVEADGAFVKSEKGIRALLKKFLIKDAYGCFSTGKECDKYFCTYGADISKIYRYPFTSLQKKDILSQKVEPNIKAELRDKLGMKEERIILAVGQFIHRKGFDILMKSMVNVSKTIGLYFIGGKPTSEYLELQEKNNLNNIHFVGYKNKSDLSDYYMAADVFILPTREDIWGLVINEAMAHGLPIITTKRCNAGLELVKTGENGYLIDVEDIKGLTKAISDIFNNIEKFSDKSLEIIRDYSIENMAKTHIRILR